ncbi:DUF2889 domain-containing protein [Pseudonocardia sp. GCM10023141]|uniref:DUF2889 domain-containing protein n=1 Tax=Pseudonocardia sp. GCM10023141 TaxID=3252653 RepID=UPI00361C21AA
MNPIDERRGPHCPTTTSLIRARGSVRRTSSIDMVWPDGMPGPLRLRGRARDINTAEDGTVIGLAEGVVDAVVDFLGGRLLRRIETSPAVVGVQTLFGTVVGPGFRGRLDSAVPQHRDADDPLFSMLDDFPVVAMIAGHALASARPPDADYWSSRGAGRDLGATLARADVCAGWARGATIMNHIAAESSVPQSVGPVAPAIDADDPDGWHRIEAIEPGSMRRRRRLDLARDATGELVVSSMFRDSFVEPDGVETIIHEYTLDARVDPVSMIVIDIHAEPRVLPWMECPSAAVSAQRLRGRTISQLRRSVRLELVGVSTCTHLNDALRALQDVVGLAAALPEGEQPDLGGRRDPS